MRAAFLTVFVFFGLFNVPSPSAQSEGPQSDGMTVQQFREFAASLPDLPGQIQAIRLLQGSGSARSVALATFGERTGWQLFVFDSVNGSKFELGWKSEKLDDSFSVSYPDALKVFSLGQEQGATFDGCAAHVCPDVFSVLLYVPSKRTSFTAKYVWGKVTYSSKLESPENSSYKAALEQLVKEHRN
jgi:hypothetical protein